MESRVSFERFAHDEDVVNDERLVIRYHDRFLTWENASAVLATLSLYRRTLGSGGGEGTNIDGEPGEGEEGGRRRGRERVIGRGGGEGAVRAFLISNRLQKRMPTLRILPMAKRQRTLPCWKEARTVATSISKGSATDSMLLDTDKKESDKLAKDDNLSTSKRPSAAPRRLQRQAKHIQNPPSHLGPT